MTSCAENNHKPPYDHVMLDMAQYVLDTDIISEEAYETARLCLIDSLGCAILALSFPSCHKLLGPIVAGAHVARGARVPGTTYVLDPVEAAFNIGTMVRWLDFNDTWLAAEWGHPSDNLGAILAIADYVSRNNLRPNQPPLSMYDVLTAMIKAHEIQGCLALENSFNRLGYDHVVLVKIASVAVGGWLFGLQRDEMVSALSQAFVDGQSLRTYRHAPNTGSRKSWAAGDATARAVRLLLLTMKGEMGYPSALTVPKWGFNDVMLKGAALQFQRPYGSYVMENILFKIAYPAEFHAQTAVECAVMLHCDIKNRLDQIATITIETHESALRIISKQGQLHNPADRDHCLQYMIAIALLYGDLRAEHYEDAVANDPRIDTLRSKMVVLENPQFSIDYHLPEKRAIANSVQIFFNNGECTAKQTIEYPLGHRRRRTEGVPLLLQKFERNMKTHFTAQQLQPISDALASLPTLQALPVSDFMTLLANVRS